MTSNVSIKPYYTGWAVSLVFSITHISNVRSRNFSTVTYLICLYLMCGCHLCQFLNAYTHILNINIREYHYWFLIGFCSYDLSKLLSKSLKTENDRASVFANHEFQSGYNSKFFGLLEMQDRYWWFQQRRSNFIHVKTLNRSVQGILWWLFKFKKPVVTCGHQTSLGWIFFYVRLSQISYISERSCM